MKVRLKPKFGAQYKLRSEPGFKAIEESYAAKIAAVANKTAKTDGFKTSSQQGARRPQGRWRNTVITAGPKAARHNAKHQTLLKATYGARGS